MSVVGELTEYEATTSEFKIDGGEELPCEYILLNVE
jgi:hypothetical protein